jgi:hypothetical protein
MQFCIAVIMHVKIINNEQLSARTGWRIYGALLNLRCTVYSILLLNQEKITSTDKL